MCIYNEKQEDRGKICRVVTRSARGVYKDTSALKLNDTRAAVSIGDGAGRGRGVNSRGKRGARERSKGGRENVNLRIGGRVK